jgi:diguanylate cyclase
MPTKPTSGGIRSAAILLARHIQTVTLVISFALAALLATFSQEGPIERSLYNVKDAVNSKPASGRIHLVEIDAKSLETLDRWPWPRGYHAKLVDRLYEAGVTQIVFDVDFSSHSSADQDAAFAASIKRSGGKVVLPTFRQSATAGDVSASFENLPIPILREHAFLGSVNVRPDINGHVNHYPFGTITDSTPRPSIGALLADTSGPVGKEFKIDQSIDVSSIPRHSFADIVNGQFDKAELKGKKVVIGATAIESGDRYATNRFGVIPGVVIQALAAETLLAGPVLPYLGAWPILLLTLLAVIVVGRLSGYRWQTMAVFAVGIAATVFGISLLAERYRLAHFELTPALLLLACSVAAQYVTGMMRKVSIERRIDSETGLPNFIAWQDQTRGEGLNAVIVAEIANFGEIASTLDKLEVRKFVRSIADRLELSSGSDRLYRIGREQFCWVAGASTVVEVDADVESSAHLFNASVLVGGRAIRATLCFGVAKGELSDLSGLANKAVLAAKRAKEFGIRSMWHDDNLAYDTDQSLFILSEFEEALMTGQIALAYQPKFNLETERVTGAEALVRWQHPDKGTISPTLFIPILEQENLIEPLTLFVLRQAINDMRSWNIHDGRFGCAINISASLLMGSSFVDQAIALIQKSNVDPKLLTFELTETAELSSLESAVSTLQKLREIGIRLSIDDYGTGQSTLTYLKSFEADEIKIDQSFVKLVATENANRIMVRSTIEMAHALGMSVVAEGVEDHEAMKLLREFGCDMIQGWHIGKAVSTDEFVRCWCLPELHNMEIAPLTRQAVN